MGFTLQGIPLNRDRYSFRSPYPHAVTARVCSLPEGRKRRREAVFRVLIPRRVRSDTGTPEGKPSNVPAVDPFLGFFLSGAFAHLNWPTLCLAGPPLTPLGGVTSLSTRVPGSLEAGEADDPFPDPRLL